MNSKVKIVDFIERISTANPTFGKKITDVLSTLPDEERNGLVGHVITYQFGDFIYKNGQPNFPGFEGTAESLFFGGISPFGIILSGSAEVVEAVTESNAAVSMPQAVLTKGSFLGLFELLDQVYDSLGPTNIDWRITAGAGTARFLNPLSTRTNFTAAVRRLRSSGAREVWNEDYKSVSSIDLLRNITGAREAINEWKTEVLFFDPKIMKLLNVRNKPHSENVSALAHMLLKSGWQSLARIRDGSATTYNALTTHQGKSTKADVIDAAYAVLHRGVEVLDGRRPCYVPISEDNELGPFSAIHSKILGQDSCVGAKILGPKYLEEGESGYICLIDLAPRYFKEKFRDRLNEVISVIVNTYIKSGKELSHAGLLDRSPELFAAAEFSIFKGGGGAAKRKKEALKFNWSTDDSESEPKNVAQLMSDVQLGDFYSPYFSSDSQPRPMCQFFKFSMKITRPHSTS